MKLSIFTDGGARGNPGPAAIGVVIKFKVSEEKTIASFGKYIGKTTNNVAEYTAVVEALKWIVCHSERSEESHNEILRPPNRRAQDDRLTPQNDINFFLDSKLVVNQLNGLFKIKDNRLHELMMLIRELEAKIKRPVFYSHLPREKNWQADKLVNETLDLPAGRQVSFHVPSTDSKAQKEDRL